MIDRFSELTIQDDGIAVLLHEQIGSETKLVDEVWLSDDEIEELRAKGEGTIELGGATDVPEEFDNPVGFLFSNGNAAFFDEDGNQLVELQREYWEGTEAFLERHPEANVYLMAPSPGNQLDASDLSRLGLLDEPGDD